MTPTPAAGGRWQIDADNDVLSSSGGKGSAVPPASHRNGSRPLPCGDIYILQRVIYIMLHDVAQCTLYSKKIQFPPKKKQSPFKKSRTSPFPHPQRKTHTIPSPSTCTWKMAHIEFYHLLTTMILQFTVFLVGGLEKYLIFPYLRNFIPSFISEG